MELVIGIIVIAVVGYFVFFRKEKDTSVYTPTPAPAPVPAQDVTPQPAEVVEGAGALATAAILAGKVDK